MRAVVVFLMMAWPAFAIADDDELDIPGLESSELRGEALVWEDAHFYAEPWENGASTRFSTGGTRRREEVGRVVPVRIVDASLKSYVEVELIQRSDCTFRKLAMDPRVGGLRLFVLRSDLAPVLIKPYALQHNDGTRIRLSPGVPLVPTSAGDYLITVRDDRLRLPIPHASVGYIYKPGKIVDEQPTGKLARIDRMAMVRFGEDSMQVRSQWVIPMPDKKTDQSFVTLNTRCIEMVGSVASNVLRPTTAPPASAPLIPRPPTGPSTWKIPPGVPLSTKSGREIAIAALAIGVGPPTGGTTCFEAQFTLVREDLTYHTGHRTMSFCAPAALVER